MHLHSRLNTWLQRIGQRQLHDEIHLLLGFSAAYIICLMVNAIQNLSPGIATSVLEKDPGSIRLDNSLESSNSCMWYRWETQKNNLRTLL